MKKAIASSASMMLLLAMVSQAAAPSSPGLPCTVGPFQSYIDLKTTCTVGIATYADFSFQNPYGTVPVSAGDITVTPTPTGLEFSGPFAVVGFESLDVVIAYQVLGTLSGASVQIHGLEQKNGGIGDTDLYFDTGTPGTRLYAASFVSSEPSESLEFTPAEFFSALPIRLEIGMLGGGEGSATITSVEQDFTATTP